MGDLRWLGGFLEDHQGQRLLESLRLAPAGALLACDDDVMAGLAARLDHQTAARLLVPVRAMAERLAAGPAVDRVVVADGAGEAAAVAALAPVVGRAAAPPLVLGFVGDLCAAAIADVDPWRVDWRRIDAAPAPQTLAIVNTPRSGSTYLCELLASLGVGRPAEHLRPGVIRLLRHRPPALIDLARLADRIRTLGGHGGVFATKLVSHFLVDIGAAADAGERAWLAGEMGRATTVYLHRRSKVDQAVSSVRAKRTGVWHSPQRPSGESEEAPIDLPLDELVIAYEALWQQERTIAAWLAGLKDVVVVDYDDLVVDPAGTCGRISARLGLPPPATPTATVGRLAGGHSQEAARRLEAHLRDASAFVEERSGEAMLDDARGGGR